MMFAAPIAPFDIGQMQVHFPLIVQRDDAVLQTGHLFAVQRSTQKKNFNPAIDTIRKRIVMTPPERTKSITL